jgi:ferredoxin
VKIHVDTRLCSGQARCWATAPDTYQLNDDGYHDSEEFEVAPGELAAASRGALACPEHAITIVDDAGAEVPESGLRANAGLPAS